MANFYYVVARVVNIVKIDIIFIYYNTVSMRITIYNFASKYKIILP